MSVVLEKELPRGWNQLPLSYISEINPKPVKNSISDDLKITFLPMKCVEELSGKIDLSITKKFQDVKKGFTFFQDEDIIFAKITPCMENGKIAITRGLKNGIGFGSTEYHVVRLYPEFSREFYFHYLIREEFRKKAKTQMKGTAGQLRVSTDYLQNVMVPVPPLNEQKRIVAKIEESFSIIEKNEKLVDSLLLQYSQIKNSILKQAFKGKLVPQDPNDEPAQILLERIQQERKKNGK